EVHDTRHCFVAVQSRCSVRHDINALDSDGGNHRIDVFVGNALAVQQGQSGPGTQSTQVDTGAAGGCALNGVGDGGRGATDKGHVLDDLAEVQCAFVHQVISVKLGNRRGLGKAFA